MVLDNSSAARLVRGHKQSEGPRPKHNQGEPSKSRALTRIEGSSIGRRDSLPRAGAGGSQVEAEQPASDRIGFKARP